MGKMGTTQQIEITLATDSTSPVIPLGGFSYGGIEIPTGSSITTLTFWTSDDEGDAADATFVESDDVAALTVAAAGSKRLPTDLFVHRYLQIRANAAGAVKINLGY